MYNTCTKTLLQIDNADGGFVYLQRERFQQ